MVVNFSASKFRQDMLENRAKELTKKESDDAFAAKWAAACPVPDQKEVVGKPYSDSMQDQHEKEVGERLEALSAELGGPQNLRPSDRIDLARHRERMPEPKAQLTAAQEDIAEAGRVEDEMNRIMRELPNADGLERELLLAELSLAKAKLHRLGGYQ